MQLVFSDITGVILKVHLSLFEQYIQFVLLENTFSAKYRYLINLLTTIFLFFVRHFVEHSFDVLAQFPLVNLLKWKKKKEVKNRKIKRSYFLVFILSLGSSRVVERKHMKYEGWLVCVQIKDKVVKFFEMAPSGLFF